MRILSNEQLIVSYRDALKTGIDKDWIHFLYSEIKRRGSIPSNVNSRRAKDTPLLYFNN